MVTLLSFKMSSFETFVKWHICPCSICKGKRLAAVFMNGFAYEKPSSASRRNSVQVQLSFSSASSIKSSETVKHFTWAHDTKAVQTKLERIIDPAKSPTPSRLPHAPKNDDKQRRISSPTKVRGGRQETRSPVRDEALARPEPIDWKLAIGRAWALEHSLESGSTLTAPVKCLDVIPLPYIYNIFQLLQRGSGVREQYIPASAKLSIQGHLLQHFLKYETIYRNRSEWLPLALVCLILFFWKWATVFFLGKTVLIFIYICYCKSRASDNKMCRRSNVARPLADKGFSCLYCIGTKFVIYRKRKRYQVCRQFHDCE
jgi:hypothetical protein